MPSFFTILSVASSVGQAFASYQQAAAMRAYYQAQADVSGLQYAQKRAEAKEQAAKVLKQVNRDLGSAVAQAAAGGILSTEGSALLQNTISLSEGIKDFNLATFNAEIIDNIGALEYANLMQTGQTQLTGGIIDALSGFGTNLTSIRKSGLNSGYNTNKEP